MPNWDALKNYTPKAGYPGPKNQLLDMIIKKGYARYEAEAFLETLWKMHSKDSKLIAQAIVKLKSKKGS